MWKKLLIGVVVLFALGIAGVHFSIQYVRSTLPKLITVDDYKPLMVTSVFDRNNKKIGEFFRERRTLIPYKEIPKDLVNAFLAAEDDSFFAHGGVNYLAILRATIANIKAGRTVQGGSTITQQVAKTLLLSSEKTFLRKIKEALLAQEMEEHLSKEDILYLYLNQIYFGQGSYGISVAAETYFRKPVQSLELAEIAILAGLPKAPSAYSPVHNPTRAKERQVYVLHRMTDVGFIKKEAAQIAINQPIKVYVKESYQEFAPFFLETVRLLLVQQLGEEQVLDSGLKVYTSLDLPKQLAAQQAVETGLKSLDKRQGFRGALRNTTEPKEVGEFLMKTRNRLIADKVPERTIEIDGKFKSYGGLDLSYDLKKNGLPFYISIGKTVEAIVSKVDDSLGLVTVKVAELEGLIDFDSMQWARKPNSEKRHDLDLIKKPSEALKTGDIILVKLVSDKFATPRVQKLNAARKKAEPKSTPLEFSKYVQLELDQDPIVESSLLSVDQETEDVVAMVGGTNFEKSQFNRALQAARQTGSAFKALIYASALDRGYTPSSPIMDAPIVYEETKEDDEGQEEVKTWKPSNHSKSFGGDIIFRNALVKSLNVPTVKIVEDIGVPYTADYAKHLGIFSPLNMDFTIGLGSSGITLFEMTKIFSEFGRAGKRTRPVVIRRVEDKHGKIILDKIDLDKKFEREMSESEKYFEEKRTAYLEAKQSETPQTSTPKLPDPKLPVKADEAKKSKLEDNIFFDDPDQLIKPTTAYLITSLLKAVVEDKNGTGGRARGLGRDVAGKTGTTNGYYDAWFIGYTQQIATGVWVGFDQEKTLGKGEVGGRAALPIWVDYMKVAHDGLPQMTFPVPEGIVFANIDSETGSLASATSKNIIRQAYLEGTEPTLKKDSKEEDTDFYKQDLSE